MTYKKLMGTLTSLSLAAMFAIAPMSSLAATYQPFIYEPEVALKIYSQIQSACSLTINKKAVSAKPYYKGRTLMLPLRTITDNLGWAYSYDAGVINFGPIGKNYKLTVGKNAYPVGKEKVKMDYAPEIADNRTYVPWQFIESGLGCKVTIKPDGKINVAINSRQTLSMYVKGKKVTDTPYYWGKTLMLPLRSTLKLLGYRYYGDKLLRASTFEAKGIYSTIYWDDNAYPIKNKLVKLSTAPQIVGGTVYVPFNFFIKAFGRKVSITTSGIVRVS